MMFNVNHKVRVKVTPEGIEALRKRHVERNAKARGLLGDFEEPETDAEGWSKWQLWDLMMVFGPMIYMGCRMPFETTIEIIEEQR